jgi:hypothetical protein
VFFEIAAIARDWAILLLALPTAVMLVVSAYLLWHLTRALRSFSPRVRPALRNAAGAVSRAAGAIDTVLGQVEAPLVTVRAAPAQARSFFKALRGAYRRR